MKHLTIILLLYPLTGHGQNWFPDEAVWHYGYSSGFGQQGYVRMEVAGDTVVAGQASRKLMRTRETYDFTLSQYSSQSLGPIIAYESAGIVQLYVPSIADFDTLYDFTAIPGQTWTLARMPSTSCDSASYAEVVDTGTVVMGTTALRWSAIDVRYPANSTFIYRDTIIERIGSTLFYFLPFDLCNAFTDGQEGGPLRCYQDLEVAYQRSNVACDFITGFEDVQLTSRPSLYPNPAGTRIFFDVGGSKRVLHASIFDARGVLVLDVSDLEPQMGMDVGNLRMGLYTIIIRSQEGKTCQLKWAKE